MSVSRPALLCDCRVFGAHQAVKDGVPAEREEKRRGVMSDGVFGG